MDREFGKNHSGWYQKLSTFRVCNRSTVLGGSNWALYATVYQHPRIHVPRQTAPPKFLQRVWRLSTVLKGLPTSSACHPPYFVAHKIVWHIYWKIRLQKEEEKKNSFQAKRKVYWTKLNLGFTCSTNQWSCWILKLNVYIEPMPSWSWNGKLHFVFNQLVYYPFRLGTTKI